MNSPGAQDTVGTTIRPATSSDYEAICRLYEELDSLHRSAWPDVYADPEGPARSREFIERIIADDNSAMLVAECQGHVAGMIYGNVVMVSTVPKLKQQTFGIIQELIVLQAKRKRGIGRALYATWIRWACRKGAESIQINVATFNQTATRFYESLGFTERLKVMFLKPDPQIP